MQRRVFFNGRYYCVQTMVHGGWLWFKPRWYHDVELEPNFSTAEAAFAYMDKLNEIDKIPVGPVSRS